MREYQEKYLRNLQRVFELNSLPGELPSPEEYLARRAQRAKELKVLSEENTALLRRELFPLLDDIITATEDDISNLEEFAAAMNSRGAYLDLVLCYYLHNAIITYARHWHKRNLLIRHLYHCAMTLFYMQEILRRADRTDYNWRMSLMFGEAASYIKQYDQIEDMETRGYIHRAMGNLALAYAGLDEADGRRKSAAIRRSLQILEDPVYHEKSPDLPWDLYLMKTHQERTTALGLLRTGFADPQIQREVMESAEYVRDGLDRRGGGQIPIRWQYAYEAAQYHCGVRPLSYLLNWLENAYLERDEGDYSPESFYRNMFLPALYASYICHSPEIMYSKKYVLSFMYRRLEAYVRGMQDNQLSEATLNNLLACLQSFVEYPDGILEKDFIMALVVCRSPDSFASSYMASQISQMMVSKALEDCPQALEGALGYSGAEALWDHKEELFTFVREACLLHNVGFLAFCNLSRRIGRSRLEEEENLIRCHVYAGARILEQSPSTRPYVNAALGHHRFFDGSGGYPPEYRREEDPNAMLTDLISAAVHLVGLLDGGTTNLEEALENLRQESGRRLSPAWSGLLIELEPELREYLRFGQAEAFEAAFRLLKGRENEKE